MWCEFHIPWQQALPGICSGNPRDPDEPQHNTIIQSFTRKSAISVILLQLMPHVHFDHSSIMNSRLRASYRGLWHRGFAITSAKYPWVFLIFLSRLSDDIFYTSCGNHTYRGRNCKTRVYIVRLLSNQMNKYFSCGRNPPDVQPLQDPVVAEIARKHSKTSVQVGAKYT